MKAENPGADQKLLMMILAERYRKLSEEDSEHYKALAKNLKEKYVIDMQKYKENLSLNKHVVTRMDGGYSKRFRAA